MNLDETLELLSRAHAAPIDLAEVALHLAQDEYPDLDVEGYLSELTAMAHEAGRYVRGNFQARVSGLCRYLFHEMGFRGNKRTYYDPRNSYLNEVLDRRTGIPILLATVAIAVGQRAGLDVAGVGLPGHFIVRASADGQEVFFDPFHGGRYLTPDQCEILVEQVTGMSFKATPDRLLPTPSALIVVRMLTNLKAIYLQEEDFARAVRVLERIRQLVPNDPEQRRDLGISLARAGLPGRALAHLQAYLDSVTGAEDVTAIRQLLDRTRSELAMWN